MNPDTINGYSKYGPLKRGNYSKDKTKRFWGYIKGQECWMDIPRFERSTSQFYKYQTP